jgi:hypothetical protein
VILVAREVSRRFLEGALRLAAFSIAHKPLEREELLIQLRRIMERYYPLGTPEEAAGQDEPQAHLEAGLFAARPVEIRFNSPSELQAAQADAQAGQAGQNDLQAGQAGQNDPQAGQAGQPQPITRRTFYFRITHFRRQ